MIHHHLIIQPLIKRRKKKRNRWEKTILVQARQSTSSAYTKHPAGRAERECEMPLSLHLISDQRESSSSPSSQLQIQPAQQADERELEPAVVPKRQRPNPQTCPHSHQPLLTETAKPKRQTKEGRDLFFILKYKFQSFSPSLHHQIGTLEFHITYFYSSIWLIKENGPNTTRSCA